MKTIKEIEEALKKVWDNNEAFGGLTGKCPKCNTRLFITIGKNNDVYVGTTSKKGFCK